MGEVPGSGNDPMIGSGMWDDLLEKFIRILEINDTVGHAKFLEACIVFCPFSNREGKIVSIGGMDTDFSERGGVFQEMNVIEAEFDQGGEEDGAVAIIEAIPHHTGGFSVLERFAESGKADFN